MEKATRQQTKEHNRKLVLKTIFEHDSISRAEIARITSLTRTTVSDIVSDIISQGLVSEIGVGMSQGGKSPILLSLAENSRCLIGLDLAHNQFRGAVVNLRGAIQEMVTLPVNDRNGDEALALVYEILDQLMRVSCQPVVGIGIGTPGLVNTEEGVVVNAVNLDWQNLPLAQLLGERYHLPVYVVNDSQAAVMGEFIYGSGYRSEESLVVINARHGIGAGIIINGRLFQGDGGGAGEIGHIVVVPEGGLPCRCGNIGCLETVASAQAIVRRVQMVSKVPREITIEKLELAFTAGDPVAVQVILQAAHYIGIAIASLIGTLNIQKIILSGDMTSFGESWLNVIRETISHTALPRLAKQSHVDVSHLGKNGIILGASALLLNDYSLLFRKDEG